MSDIVVRVMDLDSGILIGNVIFNDEVLALQYIKSCRENDLRLSIRVFTEVKVGVLYKALYEKENK